MRSRGFIAFGAVRARENDSRCSSGSQTLSKPRARSWRARTTLMVLTISLHIGVIFECDLTSRVSFDENETDG